MFYTLFVFSSRRRHKRCALVTGVQTCALPICTGRPASAQLPEKQFSMKARERIHQSIASQIASGQQIGRASCRERVCKYVSISVVAVSLNKKTANKGAETHMHTYR